MKELMLPRGIYISRLSCMIVILAAAAFASNLEPLQTSTAHLQAPMAVAGSNRLPHISLDVSRRSLLTTGLGLVLLILLGGAVIFEFPESHRSSWHDAVGRLVIMKGRPAADDCLEDASRFFVCKKRFPRTGGFVAGSSASWQAYGNCEAKPGSKPGGCLFRMQHTEDKQAQQQNAQRQNQTQYIVVLGDSQGMRYTAALVNGLQAAGASCSMQKHESGAEYFGDPAGISYGQQDCSGCASSLTRCIHPDTQVVVDVEFLRMEFVLDFEVTEKMRVHWDRNCDKEVSASPPCKFAWTTQQFYFKRYLAVRPPSQLHIFQNIHDCGRRSRADHIRDFAWFMSLLNSTLGQSASTEIYMWEATAPNPDRQPGIWKNVTSAECVKFMNEAMREAMYPMVVQTVRHMQAGTYNSRSSAAWHTAFQLFTPTSERLDLNVDGVHFVNKWYGVVASMMLAGYCADKQ